MSTSTASLPVSIRFTTPRDIPYLAALERASSADGFTDKEIRNALRDRNTIGRVAEAMGGHVCGHVLYTLVPMRLIVLSLTVAPWARRKGVATQIVQVLKRNLVKTKRTHIVATVPDTELGAHLFLRDQEFLCVGVLRGGEFDEYEFMYVADDAECEGV